MIGLGRLGSRVATIGRAFEMDVIAWSQNLDPQRARDLGVEPVGRDDVLARADVVTIQLRLSDRTRGLIGAAELARMRRSAVLVNNLGYVTSGTYARYFGDAVEDIAAFIRGAPVRVLGRR